MKAISVAVMLCACGKSDRADQQPMEPPSLSADGTVKVPPGHETTFSFDGAATRLEYTHLEILDFESRPALRIIAEGGPHHGMMTLAVPIEPGTKQLAHMTGVDIGAFPDGISFGNAPAMATGTGGWIKISEVTPTYIAGTFGAQACEMGKRSCEKPIQITDGKFKAFRSALSDDATFTKYVH